jgi:hypothetical protein
MEPLRGKIFLMMNVSIINGIALRFMRQEVPLELHIMGERSRRDDLFVENNHNQKNEPHRGDLFVNTGIINCIIRP